MPWSIGFGRPHFSHKFRLFRSLDPVPDRTLSINPDR
jgi:hypothetical protein